MKDVQKTSLKAGQQKQPSKAASKNGVVATKSKLAAAASASHKVTEYFSVRRSQRAKHPAGCKRRSPDEPCPEVEGALACDRDRDLACRDREFAEKGRGGVAGRAIARGEIGIE